MSTADKKPLDKISDDFKEMVSVFNILGGKLNRAFGKAENDAIAQEILELFKSVRSHVNNLSVGTTIEQNQKDTICSISGDLEELTESFYGLTEKLRYSPSKENIGEDTTEIMKLLDSVRTQIRALSD